MKPKLVTIIGGGIGGLALALAMHRVGIKTEIYEQASEIQEVGAGIVVYPNTFKLLKRLGLDKDILNARFHYKTAEFSTSDGKLMLGMDLMPIANEVGENCYPIHRAELLSAIAAQLPTENIHIGHECTQVTQNNGNARAFFSNGNEIETSILIGADGINSLVRKSQIIDDNTRYSGQTCFRGVADFKHNTPTVLREVNGAGIRFGVCALNENKMYWWAAVNAPEAQMIPFKERQNFLLTRFKDWAFHVEDCIKATPSENILQNDLIDRKPINSWSKGCVSLLGDAAHPTTPNLGQGANMALEDAFVLTNSLIKHSNITQAFHDFEKQRIKHTSQVVTDSWRFGTLATWKNPIAVKFRELFVKNTNQIAMKRMRKLIDYDVGSLPQS